MDKPGAWLLLAILLLLCGCTHGSLDPSSCEMSGGDPPCPRKETCPGECVSLSPLGWSLPVLLWSGPELEAPECSAARGSVMQYEGHADPIGPPKCPVCSCEPPTGECELPSLLVTSTQTCGGDGPGPTFYDFSGLDPDPMSCNTENAIAGVLGVRSLTVGPVRMTESRCKPVATFPPKSGATSWKTFARVCSFGISTCPEPGALCVPAAEPPPGFSQCIYQSGEHECPSGYPDRRVFYDEISDSPHCSECACGMPEGSLCSAPLRVYQDAFCTVIAGGATYGLTATCNDVAEGTSLWSKMLLAAATYEPGACEPSGGELTGSLELKGPTTFCCL